MKQFKAHVQDGGASRQNHFQNPECELPFLVSGGDSRSPEQSVTRAGAVQYVLSSKDRGLMGKGKVVFSHEPSRLSPSTICKRWATNGGAEIQNGSLIKNTR
jgi:hypothetical protein